MSVGLTAGKEVSIEPYNDVGRLRTGWPVAV
jgi:hypothetical protein